jgi:hypothetical protein
MKLLMLGMLFLFAGVQLSLSQTLALMEVTSAVLRRLHLDADNLKS